MGIREESDRELASRYVEATREWTQTPAGRAVNVDQKTISNWRRGRLPEVLEADVRRNILHFLETGEPVQPDEVGAFAGDLARQIDSVIRLPGDWMEKSFFLAEVSAAYRARAMDRAEERALVREWREDRRAIRPDGPRDRPGEDVDRGVA